MKVRFSNPQSGWAELHIVDGSLTADLAFSYTPRDSIRELAEAASIFVEAGCHVEVPLFLEPKLCLLRSVRVGADLLITLEEFADVRRSRGPRMLFEWTGAPADALLAFWRGLRPLQEIDRATFEREWRHPFPTAALDRLTGIAEVQKTLP